MGKSNTNVNMKAVEAKLRKESELRNQELKKEMEEEDAYWKQAGDGQKSKAQAKKDAKDMERAEANRMKADAKRMAEEEEAQMSEYGKKKEKEGRGKKMTQSEIQLMQEKQQKEQKKRLEEAANARHTSEADYAKMVDIENTNHITDEIEASGIDAAVSAMKDMQSPTGIMDKHPEKRVRGAYKTYERENLSTVMSQYPGLTLSQYKEKLWKNFLKSDSNPLK